MLLERSFCCSIETSPFKVSACESRIALCDWVSRAETRQMLHKLPEHSQGSFREAVTITDGQGLVETSHSNSQTICPEQPITNQTRGSALTSVVYRRTKQRVKSWGTFTAHDPVDNKRIVDRLDGSLVYGQRKVKSSGISAEHDSGAANRSGDHNSVVYSRRRQRAKSVGNIAGHNTGKTRGSGDQLCDSLVYRQKQQRGESSGISTELDPGKTKRSDDLLDNHRVYSRKKQRLKSNGTLSKCDPGTAKKSGDQIEGCRVYSRRKQREGSAGTLTEDSPRKTKKYGNRLNESIVYRRRKQRVKSTCMENEPGETKGNSDQLDDLLVYSRRRWGAKSSGTHTEHDPGMRSGNQLSFIGSAAASVAGESQHCFSRVEPDARASVAHPWVCSRETDASNTEQTQELPVAEVARFSDRQVKGCIHKTRSADCMYNFCSSLKSSSELSLLNMKTRAGEASKCSSSSAMVAENITKDILAKEFCTSVLGNNGLLAETWPARTSACEEEETGVDDGSSSSRLCKICGLSGTAKKMLICDKCEEAFHASCCSVQVKKVPENDEWFCPSCLKTKRKILKGTTTKRRGRNSTSNAEVNPIALMLREPHTTGVRIGKNFQVEVPGWSGPTTSDTSPFGEPQELDPSQYMHDSNTNNPKKLSDLQNWLQCGAENVYGDICGKWRRAPHSEVQTDDWECFCCVFWDPARADCATPQELETSEILEQIKQNETRPRLDAMRLKFEGAKNGGGAQDGATSD